MKLILAAIAVRTRAKSSPADALASSFVARAAVYTPTDAQTFSSEAAFWESLDRRQARTPAHLILLDPAGKLLSSEAFAAHLGRLRDSGAQRAVLAIGPADGWSPDARARADLLLSLGPMTLPHELARAVLAEQIYRALTILAGHPYHSGH